MTLSADPELQETAITKAVLLQWKATRSKLRSDDNRIKIVIRIGAVIK